MKKILLISFASLAVTLLALFLLVWNGAIILNEPAARQYPVRGVDVSAYQGEIDWPVLSARP